MDRPVNRILLIKLRAIGDVLLSTAVLPDLKAAFPGASIDFLTEKFCADVIRGNADVSDLIVFDPKTESGIGLVRRVRGRRYDMVVDLFGNPRSAVLTLLSGAPVRVGYRFNWRALCYNRVVEPRGGEIHNVEFNHDALRRIGIPAGSGKPRFPLDPRAETFAEDFFAGRKLAGGPVIAMNPGGGWISKKWRPAQFGALGRKIGDTEGAKILILWGPGEAEEAESVREAVGAAGVLAPPTTLKELASLLRRSTLLVTNDSGPMHIAASLGVPVVAIFGPTVPRLQGPVFTESEVVVKAGLDCLGCNYTACPIGNPCMLDLGVEDVYAAYTRVRQRTMNSTLTR